MDDTGQNSMKSWNIYKIHGVVFAVAFSVSAFCSAFAAKKEFDKARVDFFSSIRNTRDTSAIAVSRPPPSDFAVKVNNFFPSTDFCKPLDFQRPCWPEIGVSLPAWKFGHDMAGLCKIAQPDKHKTPSCCCRAWITDFFQNFQTVMRVCHITCGNRNALGRRSGDPRAPPIYNTGIRNCDDVRARLVSRSLHC